MTLLGYILPILNKDNVFDKNLAAKPCCLQDSAAKNIILPNKLLHAVRLRVQTIRTFFQQTALMPFSLSATAIYASDSPTAHARKSLPHKGGLSDHFFSVVLWRVLLISSTRLVISPIELLIKPELSFVTLTLSSSALKASMVVSRMVMS